MSKGDHTLGLCKAKGVRVMAVVMCMVTSLAVMAILACWAIPDGVGRVELFAEVTAMGEGEGSLGATSLCVIIVVLWRCEPLEVVLASIFYSGGQGHTPSAHGFRLITIRDEGAMIEIRVCQLVPVRGE